jgi:hypothetical protein
MAGGGCFKNLFATIGCLTVLGVGAIVGWQYRAQLVGLYRSFSGADARTGGRSVGVPGAEALRSAERKEREIERRGGPESVQLTADEMASIIEARLDPAARRALDSLSVMLGEDRFAMEGQIRVDVFSRDALGPLAEFLGSRQPLRVAGPATVGEPGVVDWRPDEFIIREFPFPPSAVPRLVNHLTGGSSGAFRIPVPATVARVRVGPGGVTFSRRAE